jgi:DNA repair exonuclease SbcCD ATPase subunit
MPSRLRIKRVEWTNFLSYGDYVSAVDLDSGGPILVVGQSGIGQDNSNGAGKTTISTAICWCLFGRVPRKAAPGDKVINWFTKSECWVKIITTDGWTITRTRKVNGHDDLLIHKDGVDVTLSTNTNAQRFLKKTFNLDYDIFVSSVFCGQFAKSFMEMSDQTRKSTLERLLGLNKLNVLGDVAKEKREAAELQQTKVKATSESRTRELESIDARIKQSKQKAIDFNAEQCERVRQLQILLDQTTKEMHSYDWILDAASLQVEWDEYQAAILNISGQRQQLDKMAMALRTIDNDVPQLQRSVKQQEDWKASFKSYNVVELKAAHAAADTAEKSKSDLKALLTTIQLDKRKLEQDLVRVDSIILEWEQKSGKECPSCKQSVSPDHTHSLSKPYVERHDLLSKAITKIGSKVSSLEAEIASITVDRPICSIDQAVRSNDELIKVAATIADLNDKIIKREQQKTRLLPSITKIEAYIAQLEATMAAADIRERYDSLLLARSKRENKSNEITGLFKQISDEEKRANPYKDLIADLTVEYQKVDESFCADRLAIQRLDQEISHLEYIRRSYHDRNKIKMFILSDIIPTLNQRIEYYLDAFECDFTIKFTPTMSVEPSRWDYDFHSGGECKRIDLAVMFALYDVYIMLYGPQCNVMVLDEVDSRLDASGVKSFVDIIQNDFAGDRQDKPDTILVISHKKEMVDQFPNQITVKMDEHRQSHIVSA